MNKTLVAYVLSQSFGSNKEGDVVHMEADEAQSLVDAGILSEAKAEDMGGDDAPEEEEVSPEENAALTRAVNRISRSLETSLATTMAKTALLASKGAAPALKVPAEPKQDVYKCAGELLKDQWLLAKGDRRAANRLNEYSARLKTSPLGSNESSNSAGGYVIRPDYASKIWDKARSYPELLSYTERVPVSGDTFVIPEAIETSLANGSRHAGVQGFWLAEGNPATASSPTVGQTTAVINTNVVLCYSTLQMLQDSNIEPFDRFISKFAGLELRWQENQAVISGAGTTQPVGVLNQAALITVNKSSNSGAAMFGFDDLVAMRRAMYAPSVDNAIWIVTPEAYNSLAQMTFINQAGTVTSYPAFGGVTYDARDDKFPLKVFGRPVVQWIGSPQVGAVGDIIFADLSQMICAEKPELFADLSNDYAFNTLQVAFRFYRRYDLRSPWTAPLTSLDGHYSWSPFIALQQRGT